MLDRKQALPVAPTSPARLNQQWPEKRRRVFLSTIRLRLKIASLKSSQMWSWTRPWARPARQPGTGQPTLDPMCELEAETGEASLPRFARPKSHVGRQALRSADRSRKRPATPEPVRPATESLYLPAPEPGAAGRAHASPERAWRREAVEAQPGRKFLPSGVPQPSGFSSARRLSSRATRELSP